MIMYNGSKIALVIITLHIFGQTFCADNKFSFTHLTEKNGLTNSHIHCIEQDAQGFIWIGTDYGLYRYDGQKFRHYINYPGDTTSISSNLVWKAYRDRRDTLWIGTFMGLQMYDEIHDNFINMNLSADYRNGEPLPVNDITEDKEGIIVVATDEGVIRINPQSLKTSIVSPLSENALFKGQIVTAYFIDKDGSHWIGTDEGVDNIFPMHGKSTHFDLTDPVGNKLNDCYIHKIFCDSKKNTWIATRDDGVFYKPEASANFIQFTYIEGDPRSLGSNEIHSFYEKANGELYITTNGGGLNIFNSNTRSFTRIRHHANDNNSLLNNNIRSILEDRQGNLWIVSFQAGVNLLVNHPRLFHHQVPGAETGLDYQSSTVCSFFLDDNDKLWIGSDGGGLKLIDRKEKSTQTYLPDKNQPGSFPDKVVMSIYKDKKGVLWFGTYQGGLVKLDKSTNRFEAYQNDPSNGLSIPNNFVTSILEDSKGNFWIGTNGGGIALFDREKEHFRNYINDPDDPNSLVSDFVNDILEDHNGDIWVATFWGLSRWNSRYLTFTNYLSSRTESNSLSDNSVFCLYEDLENKIWVGTRNGLNRFDFETEDFTYFIDKDGLSGNTINGILGDNNGFLWISTNRGLTRFNPAQKEAINFSESDGLQGNEFYRRSCYRASTGEMFFGGINGYNSFFPEEIQVRNYIPNLVITGFKILEKDVPIGIGNSGRKILNKSINHTEEITLKYSDKTFSLELSAIDFITPDKIVFGYKLEGFDENWNYTDIKYPFITYTNISPGEYQLHIKAANKNSIDSSPISKSISIKITPPIYKTWWAYFFYILSLGLISLYFWRLSIQRLKERNQVKLEKIRHEKSEEIQQAKLQFFTNISHEFRTPLTLITGPLEQLLQKKQAIEPFRKQLDIMLVNSRRMLRLINQLLDIRKIEGGKMKLKAEYSDVVKFIRDIMHSFEEYAQEKRIKFNFKTCVDSYDLWFDPDKLDKILFNLLSNSFKFTPPEGSINVDLNIHRKPSNDDLAYKEFILITVKDTGSGIPKEEIPKLFERFYQAKKKETYSQGSGLGLSLTKNYVDLHQGEIEITSTECVGTVVNIYLPEGDLHLSEDEKIISDEPTSNKYIHISPDAYKTSNEKPETPSGIILSKPNLLVVEDNIELMNYLESSCTEYFNFHGALNGKEGYELAIDILPDLIISDIMMPEMNGFEFCRRVKNHLLTSHIPVILLTAKTSPENQIEGYEAGADGYIPKPFRMDHLIATANSIIENRIRLREKFNSGKVLEGKLVKNTTDDKFLQKVIDLINTNMAEQEFGVSELGNEIGISRVHLHRKLKAISNLSPNEFIRNIRLQKAGELLLEQELNISEVCYKVGFNSPAYFSSCFKQYYHLSPTEFIERSNNT